MIPQAQARPLKYRWVLPRIDLECRKTLRESLKISRIAAQVLLNRGIADPQSAQAFMAPQAAGLHDPFLFRDMRRAVQRIERAIVEGERIAVYGDYDVDGVTGSTLLAELFEQLGHPVEVHVPDRFTDGYGLHPGAVERLAAGGVRLILTVDNGTSAHAAIERAHGLGVDVIVADHHEIRGELPSAYALLNPHRADDGYPERNLCGVGVALKLCHALLIQRGLAVPGRLPDMLAGLLDLVALGTVADVAPLTGENRYLVREGLALLTAERRPGIAALKSVAGLAGKEVGAGQVGFQLGPRINAGGRVGSASCGVAMLRATDPAVALGMAETLDRANQERREIESAILDEVLGRVAGAELPNCIVLADSRWHQGVLGIIAARVVERYHRPCVLIAIDDATGIGKGSGRSVPALHLYEALAECEDLLLGYGGHMFAAGLTIEAEQVPALARRLDMVVGRRLAPEDFQLTLHLDASARLEELNRALVDELARFSPFGCRNPEPCLLISGVVPRQLRVVGKDHLRMTLTGVNGALAAIAFGGAGWDTAQEGVPLDVVGNLSVNRWEGRETLQFRIRDIRPAVTDRGA